MRRCVGSNSAESMRKALAVKCSQASLKRGGVVMDGLGNPLRFILTGGQQHDITQAEELIAGYAGEHVLADKGYDAQEFRQHILDLGMMPVIPPRSNRKEPADYDRHLYRERHLVNLKALSLVSAG